MRLLIPLFLLTVCFTSHSCTTLSGSRSQRKDVHFFPVNKKHFRFTGRFDLSDKTRPRCWNPGAYMEVRFKGTFLELEINDEKLYGGHNFIEVAIDDLPPKRIQLIANNNILLISDSLTDGEHTLLVCKNTESSMGFIEFVGISCKQLLPLPKSKKRKIEFIGDSITCGNGCDDSQIKCSEGTWYDQHNAYMSYGPRTARHYNADWQLSSVSGIGMHRSCCGMTITMPMVYNRINFAQGGPVWNFPSGTRTEPDVVVITLGQNDGILDSTAYCSTYVGFAKHLRSIYRKATIVCCTSPMAEPKLTRQMNNYIPAITAELHRQGDLNVHAFLYSHTYRGGCTFHPTMEEQYLISKELIPFIGSVTGWE